MALQSTTWCIFFLTVLVLCFIVVVQNSFWPVSLDNFKHLQSKVQSTIPKDDPIRPQQTVTMDTCPCSRHIEELKAKDIPLHLKTNMNVIISLFQTNGLKARKGVGRKREALDPEFEVPLMHYAFPKHAVCLPFYNRSKVVLLTPNDQVSVGSAVQFRVDVYNGCGQPRLQGGDEVRAWLKTQDGHSAVAARVKDLHNGSYLAETVLPWSGVTLVRVSLTYAREFLQLSVKLFHTMSSIRYSTETLRNGGIEESVPCLPSHPIPGYAESCNFTARNGGRPWFCGRPVDTRLTCDHRSTFDNLPYDTPLPIPRQLEAYVQLVNSFHKKNPNLHLVPNNIKLLVPTGDSPSPPALPPCYSLRPRESWNTPTPRGWLSHEQWTSSSCTLPKLTKIRLKRCLRNTTLLLLGDSNQRFLWDTIVELVGCSSKNNLKGNRPRLCKNDGLHSALLYLAHAFPFATGLSGPQPISSNFPLPLALERAQNASYRQDVHHHHNLIVVIHYYMHLTCFPLQVYRNFVQSALKDVREYLSKHAQDNIKFVVRGPHVASVHVHSLFRGDKFAAWYQRVWHEEVRKFQLVDKVWFLDTWDLTLAAENPTIHPEHFVFSAIANILFSYVCDAV